MPNKKTNKLFLPHLYEPIRREIATRYAQHEFRKLLPQLRQALLWKSIDKQIENWYEKFLERNFWNAIHGISMGFRLKSLVPLITSLNIRWEKKEILLEELWFGGKFGPIGSLGTSESASEVKEKIFLPKNRKILEQTRKKLKIFSLETAPRDEFPIFIMRKKGKLRVIDGNRRLTQAIINKRDTIKSFVGEPLAKPLLYEHWVPTSLLVELVFWHKQQIQSGRKTTGMIAKNIAELIRDSSAGRIEFVERSIHKDDQTHLLLLNSVAKVLKDFGIKLKITK